MPSFNKIFAVMVLAFTSAILASPAAAPAGLDNAKRYVYNSTTCSNKLAPTHVYPGLSLPMKSVKRMAVSCAPRLAQTVTLAISARQRGAAFEVRL